MERKERSTVSENPLVSRNTSPYTQLELPDLENKNIANTVKFELQIK